MDYIPYGRQNISEGDVEAVVEALRSPLITQGPIVPDFEEALSEAVGCHFGVAVNSATSALHIACLSLGIKKGDIVWTSPITFVASANCALYCGAEVDFVDINLKSGLISCPKLRKKLEEASLLGRLPRALICVHLCGTSCDMREIKKLSRGRIPI